MPDITTAAEFVPEPPRDNPYGSLPGGGPLTAANGNMGALQGALYQSRKSLLEPDDVDEIKDTLFSRVRSPEDLAAAKEQRRGALSALQAANNLPESDWTPQRYIALGMAQNDKPWDLTYGVQKGIENMMQADLAKQANAKKSAVDNGKAGLDFEQNEQKIDEKDEGKTLEDLTSMAKEQERVSAIKGGAGGANGGLGTRYKVVAGRGLVDTWARDPVTGEAKPQVVVEGPELGRMYQKAVATAQAEAASEKNPKDFLGPDGKPSIEVYNNFIRQRANQLMNETITPHLPQDMQPGFSGQYQSPPPAVPPAARGVVPAAPAPADQRPVMKYNANPGRSDTWQPPGFPKGTGTPGVPAAAPGEAYAGPTLPPLSGNAAERAIQGKMNDGLVEVPNLAGGNDLVKQLTKERALQEAIISDPAATPKEKQLATNRRAKILEAEATAAKTAGADPVTTKTNAPASPGGSVEGVKLGTQEDNQRGVKFAEKQGADAAAFNDKAFHQPAIKAMETKLTNEQLRTIDFTPSKLANVQSTIGDWMDAAGMKGSFVRNAKKIDEAAKVLLQQSNAQIRAELGPQTDTDAARIQAEGAKITDPKSVFNFVLNQQDELADRKIARSAFVKKLEAQPDAAKQDMVGAWDKYSKENLGPVAQMVQNKPVYRAQFIKKAVQDNPDMDPKEVEQEASKDWLSMANSKKKAKK